MKRHPMKPIGRASFTAFGIALSALKIGVDLGVARAFSRPYSLLHYVSPIDAPLFHPGGHAAYYGAMWAAALPFIAVGVWLTVRRLLDAALSPYLALLFFVPFANLLFFALCAFAPSRPFASVQRMPSQDAYRASGQPVELPVPERSPGAVLFMSAGLGTVVGLGALALSVGLFREYGAALMIGTPVISGFSTGAFFARLDPKAEFRRAALATLLTCTLTLAIILVFAVEGAICMAMAFPLLVPPAFLGSFIGFSMARAVGARRVPAVLGAAVLSLPLLFLVERASPMTPLTPPPVVTEIEVNAPPEEVFPRVVRVSDMPEPTEALFAVGIAYPLRATLDEERVGAVRRCEFNTGTALETVTRYEAPSRFAFHIDTQPDPLREQTLYHTVRQPHLDGYVRNHEGIFELTALPGGRTRVRAESVYSVSITPEWYWRLWTDAAVHTIHRRVLAHVKAEAERGADRPTASR